MMSRVLLLLCALAVVTTAIDVDQSINARMQARRAAQKISNWLYTGAGRITADDCRPLNAQGPAGWAAASGTRGTGNRVRCDGVKPKKWTRTKCAKAYNGAKWDGSDSSNPAHRGVVPAMPGRTNNAITIMGNGGMINQICANAPATANCVSHAPPYNRLWIQNDQWNMCANYQWVSCAARSLLPGNPNTNEGGKFIFPGRVPSGGLTAEYNGSPVVTAYEFCFLASVCENTDELMNWPASNNRVFTCKKKHQSKGPSKTPKKRIKNRGRPDKQASTKRQTARILNNGKKAKEARKRNPKMRSGKQQKAIIKANRAKKRSKRTGR